MKEAGELPASAWRDAELAAALLAIDPASLGGAVVRASPGPVRDRWLALLRDLLPGASPIRRIAHHIGDERLLGGLELAATLRSGRPVVQRGVLAEADGGIVVLAMAERAPPAMAARLAAVLDAGEVVLEREGLGRRFAARIAVVALDEGIGPDEHLPAALRDRLAFHVAFEGVTVGDLEQCRVTRAAVASARRRWPGVRVDEAFVEALCAAAVALGIASIRPCILAVRVARAAAALAGRRAVTEEDAVIAGRLVLAPRATQRPTEAAPAEQEAPTPDDGRAGETPRPDAGDEGGGDGKDVNLGEIVLAAASAAIPAGLLAHLKLAVAGRVRTDATGRAGAPIQSARRGRPAGTRRGDPRAGARLNVVQTLRAAAPWQALRRREAGASASAEGRERRVLVRGEDFHVTRFKHRSRTTTIFVVDASGSSALHRLAESKGAVELLLADCYVRRDQVALIAFRGQGAEIILPPTRSLVRARRSLAALPGGGGTPLARGIDAAALMAEAARRRGETPVVVLLTDGRANVARDGGAGRERAQADALAAARAFRGARCAALLLDTSPRPHPEAAGIAEAMQARYLPLPHADAHAISRAVQAANRSLKPG